MQAEREGKNMAKTDNIFFRVTPTLIEQLEEHYESAGLAASKITKALPYLRSRTLEELKSKFTKPEIMFIIITLAGKSIDPQFITDKESVKRLMIDAHTMNKKEQQLVNLNMLLEALSELSAAQLYFLFDFCSQYYKEPGTNLQEYASQLI
jgi:hypothetical protein